MPSKEDIDSQPGEEGNTNMSWTRLFVPPWCIAWASAALHKYSNSTNISHLRSSQGAPVDRG